MVFEPIRQAHLDQAISALGDTMVPMAASFYKKLLENEIPDHAAVSMTNTLIQSLIQNYGHGQIKAD